MNSYDDRCRLYLITPSALRPVAFVRELEAALDAGVVAAVQLRLKGVTDEAVEAAFEAIAPVCRAREVALILNDRPDLAAALGADGVHIGQDDASYEEARATVGPDAVVGVTCHNSRHLAMVAGEKGADYVAFGAFFPTNTKNPKAHATPEILAWWHELMTVPSVAIGGITPENCDPLVHAGADFLAVSAGVWQHPKGPAAAVRAFEKAIEEAAKRPWTQ